MGCSLAISINLSRTPSERKRGLRALQSLHFLMQILIYGTREAESLGAEGAL